MEPHVITIKTIGDNIRKHRQLRQVKQEYLARKTQLSISAISRLENGQRDTSLKKLLAIAEVLETHPAEFLKNH